MNDIIFLLSKNPFLESFSQESLEKIAKTAKTKQFNAGDIILKEGELADAFYIILNGDVRIFTLKSDGEKLILARFQKGYSFGERAFATSVSPRRTATVEALASTTLLVIPRKILIELRGSNSKLDELLQRQFNQYIKEKIEKLMDNPERFLNFSNLSKKNVQLKNREIIYRQGSPATHIYLLSYGHIELREYDPQWQIIHKIELEIGELFGTEAISSGNCYQMTAIAKEDSEVVAISSNLLNEYLNTLSELLNFKRIGKTQQSFDLYTNLLQFRGQYEDLPTFVTLFLLKDGREVMCHRAIQTDLLYISTLGVKSTQTYLYSSEGFIRKLFITDHLLVGLHESGQWEDTDDLLDRINRKIRLTEEELTKFKITGHLDFPLQNKLNNNEILCKCMRVKKSVIEELVKKEFCTFENIRTRTGASTVCGACRPDILEILGNNVWIPCKVSHSIKHTETVRSFRLHPISKTPTLYLPGQHIILRANIENALIQRSYTLTTKPEENYFEVTVKKEPKGLFSSWLFDQEENNLLLHVSGPFGNYLLTEGHNPIICLAGGIGITPFIAFCRYLFLKDPDREIYLDYSARTHKGFIFRDELEMIFQKMNQGVLHFRDTTIEERININVIENILQDYIQPDIYLCGPTDFENSLQMILETLNIPSKHIHIEHFLQAGAPLAHIEQM